MDLRYVLTAFGKDRPGVVADVSRIIYEIGGNLEDSTMTRLIDEFAIILLFSVRENVDDQLHKACRRLEREKSVSVYFRNVTTRKNDTVEMSETHKIHVEGMDHTGIVFRVSNYLAGHKINILNLSSRVTNLPESGSSIYTMEIHVHIPENSILKNVEQGLNQLRDELNVEVLITPV
jgi:glycine cleavage system transcriptional repressor